MATNTVGGTDLSNNRFDRFGRNVLSMPVTARVRTALYLTTLRKDISVRWDQRRTIGALEALDDRMLQDVGLVRCNIRELVNAPTCTDPRLRI